MNGYLSGCGCRICRTKLTARGKFPGGNEPLGIFDDAGVAEPVDAAGLEPAGASRGGSNPSTRTT